MSALPTIRMELDGLRYQIVHALATHNRETEEFVATAVSGALESFDFGAAVEHETRRVLQDAIKRSVSEAICDLFSRREVKAAVESAIRESLACR